MMTKIDPTVRHRIELTTDDLRATRAALFEARKQAFNTKLDLMERIEAGKVAEPNVAYAKEVVGMMHEAINDYDRIINQHFTVQLPDAPAAKYA